LCANRTPQETTIVKILQYLAEHGPATRYQIRVNAAAGSQPTILSAVKDLQIRKALVAKSNKSKTGRGPRPRQYYDLSLYGLILLMSKLSPREDHRSLLRHVAIKYRYMIPNVFEVWELLTEAKVDDLATNLVLGACSYVVEMLEDVKVVTLGRVLPFDEAIKYFASMTMDTQAFLDPDHVFGRVADSARWRNALSMQRRLRLLTQDNLRTKAEHFVEKMGQDLKQFGDDSLRTEVMKILSELGPS
jgi:hypothetical protein